jgi:hypothetical protein
MARGWESKSVEAQQEEAARGRKIARPLTDEERAAADWRRSLELARARSAADLSRARAPGHREMLQKALAAIEAQLKAPGT